MSARSSVFIGSSTEGLETARALRTQLDKDAEITLWNEGIFPLSQGYLEALVNALPRFDFAVLVFSADDEIKSRGISELAPRDNVMFELGLFMGRLGRERTFVLYDDTQRPKLPSDLAGVSTATYRSDRADGNIVAAVGAASDSIRSAIRSLGVHESRGSRNLQQATDSIEYASNTVAKLVGLLARSRAVELDVISRQFGGLMPADILASMRQDLADLQAETKE
ncbi:MAG: hypothetical protein B7Z37_22165 [Verrucomicrobia bacterium 12-59-8]|nr:MAG: hypothetical protein B7Z37_22165 [Verrucomicrobia bacterium 12-59-8]